MKYVFAAAFWIVAIIMLYYAFVAPFRSAAQFIFSVSAGLFITYGIIVLEELS